MKRLFDWLRKAALALLTEDEAFGVLMRANRGPWRMNTGADYRYPVSIPGAILEQGPDVVQRFVEASTVFDHQFDTPYQTDSPWQTSRDTSTPLREWDYETRRTVLERTHILWERDPIANAAVSFNRLFAVQKGHNVRYLNTQVQAVIEAFRGNPENAVLEQDKTMLDALQVDGELFIRFNEGTSATGTLGDLVISPLKPWGVQWIEHEIGFIRRPVEYRYRIWESDGTGRGEYLTEDIPAGDVLHVAVNRLHYEQRGRPELFKVIEYLRGWKEWLENRARQNYWKGAVLGQIKLTNATAAQVSAKRAQYKEPPNPGSWAITNDKEDWEVFTTPVGAGDASDDGRQLKLQNAVGLRLPEYFLSDGDNANLASATAQQLPALRSFEEWQDIMAEQVWMPIYERVVRVAVEAGLIPAEVREEGVDGEPVEGARTLPADHAFVVSYPPIASGDPKNLMEALQIAVANEWLSNETAASNQPWQVDVHVERKKIEAEKQRAIDDPFSPLVRRSQMGAFQFGAMPGSDLLGEPESQEDDEE